VGTGPRSNEAPVERSTARVRRSQDQPLRSPVARSTDLGLLHHPTDRSVGIQLSQCPSTLPAVGRHRSSTLMMHRRAGFLLSLMRGGQRCPRRASRAGRATTTTARAFTTEDTEGHGGPTPERPSSAFLRVLRGSMPFGSCQERESSLRFSPVSKGAMPEWSWQRGGPLGIHQPVRPIRSMMEQFQCC